MSIEKTGGPAFPQAHDDSGWSGMTLRDYFAAKAMHGLISNAHLSGPAADLADISYTVADAMLEARK